MSATDRQPPAGDTRSFFALVGVIFQGALSDNIFRYLLMMLAIALANSEVAKMTSDELGGLSVEQAQTARANLYQLYVSASFLIPYILLPSLAGWLSDRFSKARVVLWTKLLEFGIMVLALVALGLGPSVIPGHYVWAGVFVLFLMGVQSTLFSPARYGIQPELLPAPRLAWANGIVQAGVFGAVVLGTILGPMLFDFFETRLWIPPLILIALSVIGCAVAWRIAPTPAKNPSLPIEINPLPMLAKYGAEIVRHRVLLQSMVGLFVFWMAGMMILETTILTMTTILDLKANQVGIALLPVVLAQGVGCGVAAAFSTKRIELRLVPVGAIGVAVAGVLSFLVIPGAGASEVGTLQIVMICGAIALAGFFCGFFIVPLEAWFVERTDPEVRGGVWAVSNTITIVGTLVGLGIKYGVTEVRHAPGDVFLAVAASMLLVGIYLAPMCLRRDNA